MAECTRREAASWRPLIWLLLLAFVLRFGAAVLLPNIDAADEIFQTREPAHSLAFGYGIKTWEWRVGVRSWIFPAILAGIMRATAWMGVGPRGYLTGIAVCLSLLSLTSVWFAYRWGLRAGRDAALVAGFLAACWYQLVYYAPKALNEVVATHLFLPGFYLACFADANCRGSRRSYFAGMLLGSAVAIRVPLAPIVVTALFIASRRLPTREWTRIFMGSAIPLAVMGMTDAIVWRSYPFSSVVRYAGVAWGWYGARPGEASPWYLYAPMLAVLAGPILYFAMIARRRAALLLVVTAIVVVTHSFFAQKEPRYMYPVLPLLAAAAGLGLWQTGEILRERFHWRHHRRVMAGMLAFMATLSIFWGTQFETWSRNRGNLLALESLSTDTSLCGVALAVPYWTQTGGYTYLHRRVPIYLLDGSVSIAPESRFNVIVANPPLASSESDFTQQGCWYSQKVFNAAPVPTCVYRRPGPCTPSPGYDISDVLRARNQ